MSIPSFFDSTSKWISSVLLPAGGLATLLYFLLKKTLEKTIDSRFNVRLENVKHELQLEQQKMSIVYANQKDSFRNIIKAMHRATEAIHENEKGGIFRAIPEQSLHDFSQVVAEEILFLDSSSVDAVGLFQAIMLTAVRPEHSRGMPGIFTDEYQIARARNEMQFVLDRLAAHFRIRVGLEPNTPDPLLDIELLGACRVINRFRCDGYEVPPGRLNYRANENAFELVSIAREKRALLISELSKLKDCLAREHPPNFAAITVVDGHLRKLDDGYSLPVPFA